MALGRKTGGRRKGSQNRLTGQAKEAFELAFTKIGGVKRLSAWADENPSDFYRIYGKLIPQPREHSGPDGDAIPVSAVIVMPEEKP